MPRRKKQMPPSTAKIAAVEPEAPQQEPAPTAKQRQDKAQATLELVVDRLIEAIDIGQIDVSKLNGITIEILRQAAQGRFAPTKKAVREIERPGSQLESLLSRTRARPQREAKPGK